LVFSGTIGVSSELLVPPDAFSDGAYLENLVSYF
jgi:hypothetical protein